MSHLVQVLQTRQLLGRSDSFRQVAHAFAAHAQLESQGHRELVFHQGGQQFRQHSSRDVRATRRLLARSQTSERTHKQSLSTTLLFFFIFLDVS